MAQSIQERNELILKALKNITKSLTTPELARAYLISTGIYNKDGTLHKNYTAPSSNG